MITLAQLTALVENAFGEQVAFDSWIKVQRQRGILNSHSEQGVSIGYSNEDVERIMLVKMLGFIQPKFITKIFKQFPTQIAYAYRAVENEPEQPVWLVIEPHAMTDEWSEQKRTRVRIIVGNWEHLLKRDSWHCLIDMRWLYSKTYPGALALA